MAAVRDSGSPRASEAEQSNYAQLIIEIYDKEDMPKLVGPLQIALVRQWYPARIWTCDNC